MKARFVLLVATLAGLSGCTVGTLDPLAPLARSIHAQYLRGPDGFGLDPGREVFYDSFESSSLPGWIASTPSGDTWHTTSDQANFGTSSLTYGSSGLISNAVSFGTSTLTTQNTISLAGAIRPVLVVFARFMQEGAGTDETALRLEASLDLGFTWTPLVAQGLSTPNLTGPLVTPGAPDPGWKRYDYDLSPYDGQAIRLRIDVEASLGSRTLPYLDDLLVAETH